MSTLLLSLCIVVWLIHLWVSYRSLDATLTWFRRAAFSLMGLLGLFFAICRPEISSVLPSYDAIVLTPDYNPIQRDSLEKSIKDVEVFNSLEDYFASSRLEQITSVHLLGQGIHPMQANLLQNKRLIPYPPSNVMGIRAMDYQVAEELQPWILELQVTTDISKGVIVTPRGTSIDLDIRDDYKCSQELPGLVAGRYTYQLKLITTSSDTLYMTIPQEVRPTRKYSLLTLLQAPSFEVNYFKNYWSDLGNSYAQRIKISQDKYLQNFVNRRQAQLETIESTELEEVDFIIADITAWNQLSDTERARILRKVESQGLGLLFRLDGDTRPVAIPEVQVTPTEVVKVNTLKGTQDIRARGIINTRSWNVIEQDGITLGYRRARGRGYIGFISLENSYKLLLADASSTYQSYWSTLLSSFFVDIDIPYLVQRADPIWAGESTALLLFTERGLETPITLNDSINLSWINNPFIDNSYVLELAPAQGWNRIRVDDARPYYFYAYAPDELAGPRYQRNVDALTSAVDPSPSPSIMYERIPIAPWWPWSMVIIGLGLLWLDERLF